MVIVVVNTVKNEIQGGNKSWVPPVGFEIMWPGGHDPFQIFKVTCIY